VFPLRHRCLFGSASYLIRRSEIAPRAHPAGNVSISQGPSTPVDAPLGSDEPVSPLVADLNTFASGLRVAREDRGRVRRSRAADVGANQPCQKGCQSLVGGPSRATNTPNLHGSDQACVLRLRLLARLSARAPTRWIGGPAWDHLGGYAQGNLRFEVVCNDPWDVSDGWQSASGANEFGWATRRIWLGDTPNRRRCGN
jgi:hypothetical protein